MLGPLHAGDKEDVLITTESSPVEDSGSTEFLSIPGNQASLAPPSQPELDAQINRLVLNTGGVSVKGIPMKPRSPVGKRPFTRQEGFEIGMPGLATLKMVEFKEPQNMGRGIASGDVDNDGYVDILLASRDGVKLYRNSLGSKFRAVDIDIPGLKELNTFNVALVDLNNDSWLDIFLTSYLKGNYVLLNKEGGFGQSTLVKVASPKILTESMAFGDIDQDGDLDAVLGNWLRGTGKGDADDNTINTILMNDHGRFSQKPLPGSATGDTLSTLLSDFTHDNVLDLIVGNDFRPPDLYYRGNGKGEFIEITRNEDIIPVSTNTTMSIDTADFDNDLDLDIYVTQVAAAATGPSVHIKSRRWLEYCDDIKNEVEKKSCREVIRRRILIDFRSYTKFRSVNIKQCKTLPSQEDREDCAAFHVYLAAILKDKKELCELIPKGHEDTRFHCQNRWAIAEKKSTQNYENTIPVIKNENVFLEATGNNRFKNIARDLGVETTGWSWSSKFADLDNDGFQDIYVANGFWSRLRGAHTKYFFHNQGGKSFIDRTDAFGLQNYMVQPGFTEIDFDNDGDLDIFSTSVNGPIWFYRNNNRHNNAVEFMFNDRVGNFYGIGNKIIIHYGENQKEHQLREMKAGGGFLSFNAPVLHFGLGTHEAIDKVEVFWSTGERTEISGPIPVSTKYIISRK